jgi:hypothetical protein
MFYSVTQSFLNFLTILNGLEVCVLPPARFGLTLLKKIRKNYETLGLHSLHIRLQTCAINFPVSLHS